jgi:hypothetical protein
MRTLMALALLLLTAAPAQPMGTDLYPVPGGRPCDSWGSGRQYQRDAWNKSRCGGGKIRKAMGGKDG